MKQRIYYIGNAHMDHTWLWRWMEGYDEVHATFRAALERMDEDEEFVFTSAVALHYYWIEENDPAMFEQIRRRVKEGRWQIAGGWWVQPDNNIPHGESFARQGLYGQRYFKSRFGKMARTGYCVDSFGHNGQLPQILRRQGMTGWLAFRPEQNELKLPGDTCIWRGIDGSEVAYSRPPRFYNTAGKENIEAKYKLIEEYLKEWPEVLFFYGIGDHGGGPTKRDIELIRMHISADSARAHVWGNLDEFYGRACIAANALPVHKGDLQYSFRGCYTTQHEIKALNRLCESKLYAAESLAALASMCTGAPYAQEEITEAWKKALVNQFHDVICGTCTPDATEDSKRRFAAVIDAADRIAHFAAHRLTDRFDTRPPAGYERTVPFSLVNPLPRARRIPLEIHPLHSEIIGNNAAIVDAHGKPVECQWIAPHFGGPGWELNRILFAPDVPACGAALFHAVPHEERKARAGALAIGRNRLENRRWRIRIDAQTGCIRSLHDKRAGRELVRPGALMNRLLVIRDLWDTWGTGADAFDEIEGEFTLKSIDVIERGPLRAAFQIQREYKGCRTRERIALYRDFDWVDFTIECMWLESQRMVKIAFPLALNDTRSFYEIPFGSIKRPTDGTEQPMQRWVEVRGKTAGGKLCRAGIAACTIGGADVREGELRLTLLRSPLYGFLDDRGLGGDVDLPANDQGVHRACYRLFVGAGDLGLAEAADDLSVPHEIVWEGTRRGETKKPLQHVECSPDSIHVSALKRAEDGNGFIVRLYETRGRTTPAVLRGPRGWRTIRTTLKPYEIQTFRWAKNGKARKCNMLEFG